MWPKSVFLSFSRLMSSLTGTLTYPSYASVSSILAKVSSSPSPCEMRLRTVGSTAAQTSLNDFSKVWLDVSTSRKAVVDFKRGNNFAPLSLNNLIFFERIALGRYSTESFGNSSMRS